MTNKVKERVLWFSASARFVHWGHTVTFLVLLFTGLAIFSPSLEFLAPLFGGFNNAGLIHRIMAVFYTMIPLICLIINPKGFIEWWKDVFNFTINDMKYLMVFPLEFFGFPVKIPPQTRFNGGEKINSVVTTTSCVFLAISGYIMWFPGYFSLWLVRAAYPIHDICMIVATCMVCLHAYLGSLHPGSSESLQGMLGGTVQSDWAAHHHAQWYEEVTSKK